MATNRKLPALSDFPIPPQVQSGGKGWTEQMDEMADHIGAYDTLRIVARLGGRIVYIPIRPQTSPFREIVGYEKAAIISHVYGPYKFSIPVARYALSVARRGGLIAAVRAGTVSMQDAAVILNTTRGYVWNLIANTDEGIGVDPSPLPVARELRLLRDASDIAAAALIGGASERTIGEVRDKILALAETSDAEHHSQASHD